MKQPVTSIKSFIKQNQISSQISHYFVTISKTLFKIMFLFYFPEVHIKFMQINISCFTIKEQLGNLYLIKEGRGRNHLNVLQYDFEAAVSSKFIRS